ncbi:MAG TPA: hypothetical protein VLF67_05010 [Candidatus Saccharimonas sp.]|nr:hypothetical protein [Candidatus Saccharimonas sp.]
MKRKLMAWGGLMAVAITIATGIMVTTAPTAQAGLAGSCPTGSATPLNTTRWCGYFKRQYEDTGAPVLNGGIPGGVVNVASWVNFVNGLRSGTTQQRTAAAFYILTMLKVNSSPGAVTIAYSNTRWNDWLTMMNWYAANPGYVDFNYGYLFPCGILNTYYQRTRQDIAYFFEPASSGVCGLGVRQAAILFYDPITGLPAYAIRRACANPIGGLPGIGPLPWSLTGSLTTGTGTPPFGGILQPGVTYNLSPSVTNTSIAPATNFTMAVGNESPAYIQYAGSSSPGGYATVVGYGSPCPATTPCWYWGYPGLPAGVTSAQTNGLQFTIAPATPEGTSVCVDFIIFPSSSSGGSVSQGPNCWTVYRPHYPGVIGTDGDVHAGGGVCGQAQNANGAVTTSPQSNSLGEYVVSASGLVAGFGSNNTAGSTAATLGRNGDYYTICRPDLVTVGRNYFLGGQPTLPLPAGSHDVGLMAPGVYVHNGGGDVTLYGTFTNKITILALTDRVIISGPLMLSAPPASASNVPSMGIIANGNIVINGAANRVDAYLFSNGTIDTCAEGNAAPCKNTLTVNGFLMGNTLAFHRVGPASLGGPTATVGEIINMTGQIYLNPPKLFDSAADVNLLQSLGERPPLN